MNLWEMGINFDDLTNPNRLIGKKVAVDIETTGGKTIIKKAKIMRNLNITNGSRTIWVSFDGKETPVKDLAIPHLLNILEKLHRNYFEANLGQSALLAEIDSDKYLNEYCPTYQALKSRAMKLRLPVIGCPINSYGRPKSSALESMNKEREKEKLINKLDFFTGNSNNALDVLAEAVVERINRDYSKRKSVNKRRKR